MQSKAAEKTVFDKTALGDSNDQFHKGSLGQLALLRSICIPSSQNESGTPELDSYRTSAVSTTSGIGIRRVRIDLMLRERSFRADQAP